MQRDCVDIGVSRLIGRQLSGKAQLGKRLIEPFEPHQRQAERMVNARILRNCSYGASKDVLSIRFPLKAPVQISQVDRCRCILVA